MHVAIMHLRSMLRNSYAGMYGLYMVSFFIACMFVIYRYTPPREEMPIAAAIGSPNYGYRSVIRDLEAHFLIVTTNTSLRKVWRLLACNR